MAMVVWRERWRSKKDKAKKKGRIWRRKEKLGSVEGYSRTRVDPSHEIELHQDRK